MTNETINTLLNSLADGRQYTVTLRYDGESGGWTMSIVAHRNRGTSAKEVDYAPSAPVVGGAANPMQPVRMDDRGVVRFKENSIVRHLLDNGDITLNDLARIPFSDADRSQFAQLIGYSVSGWSDLMYVTDAEISAAEAQSEMEMKA